MYIYISLYVHTYIYIYIYIIYIYYIIPTLHIASVRFEHYECRRSLVTTYVCLYIRQCVYTLWQ